MTHTFNVYIFRFKALEVGLWVVLKHEECATRFADIYYRNEIIQLVLILADVQFCDANMHCIIVSLGPLR